MTGVSPFENGTMAKMFALMVLFYLMTYVAAMLFRGYVNSWKTGIRCGK